MDIVRRNLLLVNFKDFIITNLCLCAYGFLIIHLPYKVFQESRQLHRFPSTVSQAHYVHKRQPQEVPQLNSGKLQLILQCLVDEFKIKVKQTTTLSEVYLHVENNLEST